MNSYVNLCYFALILLRIVSDKSRRKQSPPYLSDIQKQIAYYPSNTTTVLLFIWIRLYVSVKLLVVRCYANSEHVITIYIHCSPMKSSRIQHFK